MTKLERLIQELCPDGVKYHTIDNIALKITDGMHSLPNKLVPFSDYPILSAQNINSGNIGIITSKYVSKEIFEIENRRTDVQVGDVLLTIVGAIGRVAVVNEPITALFQRSVCIIRVDQIKVLPYFLKYALETSESYDYMFRNAHGAAQKGLYLKQVAKILIPVPPLEVQSEIVKVLDNYTEQLAELTAKLEAELMERKKQYEYYRDKLLTFSKSNQ